MHPEGRAGETHLPVMPGEVLRLLDPGRGGLFVDGTVGLGGHAEAVLAAGAGRLLGFDRDRDALARARERLRHWETKVELLHADVRTFESALDARGIGQVNGILLDLGVSSMQLDAPGRGFSFRRDEPLDMRMDQSGGETAAALVERLDESELADVIFRLGEERYARRIARAIVQARSRERIATTGTLATVVRRALPSKGWQRIDPATRTFQALRIAVNRELDGLDGLLVAAANRLAIGARLVVLAFHSLEDRVVKQTFRALGQSSAGALKVVTRRPLVPEEAETMRNPRARSAKLRAIERAPASDAA